MQKRAVVVCVAATLLGLLAVVLGFAAEHFQKKAFVRSDRLFLLRWRRRQAAARLRQDGVRGGCVAAGGVGGGDVRVRRVAERGRNGRFTAVRLRRRPGRDSPGGGGFDFVCDDLRDGVFVSASVTAAIGISCAITACIDNLQHSNRTPTPTPTLGVAMGQLQHPVAYPAQPPNGAGPGGNGAAKIPAGTASA
ncbi:unnamed protein product [Urochloa decumbens]|uniref:Uncharacterized protein n=1 Tax=Urochloa decumbens TaxID=240449 RepID=A0ABC9CJT5_9POAL